MGLPFAATTGHGVCSRYSATSLSICPGIRAHTEMGKEQGNPWPNYSAHKNVNVRASRSVNNSSTYLLQYKWIEWVSSTVCSFDESLARALGHVQAAFHLGARGRRRSALSAVRTMHGSRTGSISSSICRGWVGDHTNDRDHSSPCFLSFASIAPLLRKSWAHRGWESASD
jgi:hypothetical protein